MIDALIDPTTGDYTQAAGSTVRDLADGLGNAVYLRLQTPLGGYWADATLGSRLHELQRMKDVPRMSVLAKQYAEQALAPIVADGRAVSVEVTTYQPGKGWLILVIEVTAASGARRTFKHPVKVM